MSEELTHSRSCSAWYSDEACTCALKERKRIAALEAELASERSVGFDLYFKVCMERDELAAMAAGMGMEIARFKKAEALVLDQLILNESPSIEQWTRGIAFIRQNKDAIATFNYFVAFARHLRDMSPARSKAMLEALQFCTHRETCPRSELPNSIYPCNCGYEQAMKSLDETEKLAEVANNPPARAKAIAKAITNVIEKARERLKRGHDYICTSLVVITSPCDCGRDELEEALKNLDKQNEQ